MKRKFVNGEKVRDRISGFEGTITAVAEYINGCIRYQVQPELDEHGNYRESQMFDEQQLERLQKKREKKVKPTGGDRPPLPKFKL
jgi:hypothetical protein